MLVALVAEHPCWVRHSMARISPLLPARVPLHDFSGDAVAVERLTDGKSDASRQTFHQALLPNRRTSRSWQG
jgi:hypothetical protein